MGRRRLNFDCQVEGCERPAYVRQMCRAHYSRLHRHGDPLAGGPFKRLPLAERFWRYVRKTEDCWLWTGSTDRLGYGRMHREGVPALAHRISYELEHGALPEDGLELDHVCRNPSCVNPAHLEAVTHAENLRRGRVARGVA